MNQSVLNTDSSKQKTPFAEVIESNLHSFTAQCWQWDKLPTFGSLVEVTTNNHKVLGCVTQIRTESIDPTRKPRAYQKTEEELLREQPQIFEMLQSIFTVQVIAYQQLNTGQIRYLTPLQPCKIHAFIRKADEETFSTLFSTPDFLHMLFACQNNIDSIDELLLAILHQIESRDLLTKAFFDKFYQSFALLHGNDYKKMKLFFERIEMFSQNNK